MFVSQCQPGFGREQQGGVFLTFQIRLHLSASGDNSPEGQLWAAGGRH